MSGSGDGLDMLASIFELGAQLSSGEKSPGELLEDVARGEGAIDVAGQDTAPPSPAATTDRAPAPLHVVPHAAHAQRAPSHPSAKPGDR